MSECSIAGCLKPSQSRSWCQMHYTRWKRHGSPLTVVAPSEHKKWKRVNGLLPVEIRRLEDHCEMHITRRDGTVHAVIYDHADAEFIESRRWHIHQSVDVADLYYARLNGSKEDPDRNQYMHILLMGRKYVDHANHNGLDNRRSNLRLVTKAQNAANSRNRKDSRSGLKGVSWRPHAGKWASKIKGRHLGYFATAEEAARAYDDAALAEFGEFACLNFPGDR